MLAICYGSFRGGGGGLTLPPTHPPVLYTLACKVESSVQGRVGGSHSRAPACPGRGASVRTFLCWFGKRLELCSKRPRKKNFKRGGGGGKNKSQEVESYQIQKGREAQCRQDLCTNRSKQTRRESQEGDRAPRRQLVRVCSRPLEARGSPAAECPSSDPLPFLFSGLPRLCWKQKAGGKETGVKSPKCLKSEGRRRPAVSRRRCASGSFRLPRPPARGHPQSAAVGAESGSGAVKMRGGGTMNL